MLYQNFPREFGKKRILVKTPAEFVKLVNKYNGRMDIFLSLYSFDYDGFKIDYNKPLINVIYWDFDEDDAQENVIKLHEYCLERSIRHMNVLSGRGFNFYLSVEETPLKYPKDALRNAQTFLLDKLDINMGCDSGADAHVIGDIRRISRILNTLNIKAKRYCITLPEKLLYSKLEKIQLYAAKQRKPLAIGNTTPSLKKFDYQSLVYKPIEDVIHSEIFPIPDVEDLPPCLQTVVSKKVINHLELMALTFELSDIMRCGEFMDEESLEVLSNQIIDFFQTHEIYNVSPQHTEFHIRYLAKRCQFGGSCGFRQRKGICMDGENFKCYKKKI